MNWALIQELLEEEKWRHADGSCTFNACDTALRKIDQFRADARLGRAVRGMPVGAKLRRCGKGAGGPEEWEAFRAMGQFDFGPTPEAALVAAGLMEEEK